ISPRLWRRRRAAKSLSHLLRPLGVSVDRLALFFGNKRTGVRRGLFSSPPLRGDQVRLTPPCFGGISDHVLFAPLGGRPWSASVTSPVEQALSALHQSRANEAQVEKVASEFSIHHRSRGPRIMSSALKQQANYWDRQSTAFDAIYTHHKSGF